MCLNWSWFSYKAFNCTIFHAGSCYGEIKAFLAEVENLVNKKSLDNQLEAKHDFTDSSPAGVC